MDLKDFDEQGQDTPKSSAPNQETASVDASEKAAKPPLSALYNVPVNIKVVLGAASLSVNQLLKLGRGAVVEIDRKVGEAVDIHINNHLVARGEVVIVEDDRLGVTLTDIVDAQMLNS
ncbi:hypothetical protein GCM10007972_23550 [Iodidimonas muriae]|uniref:Flagellar motor switch protein FliN n=1 Tax=Iodidimonas muriae TaxID=261467 RepID=A0ABQ2LFE7_9PROT|nr:flagellar motor switch protein FliN [Iodidimonas muriae]GER08605.1 hypothetical protein JCM17843_29150 [Kordiimonadales bacterium JCM 17843]GGO15450.1 hypothetical protein GCM10007972_23550 [Iodidimonas muriae]